MLDKEETSQRKPLSLHLNNENKRLIYEYRTKIDRNRDCGIE